MGQMSGEVQRVLACAAADLQDVPRVSELCADDFEDRPLVALGRLGYGELHGSSVPGSADAMCATIAPCPSLKKVSTGMQAIEALLQRHSARALQEPGPDEAALALMLESATRAPDHGRLRPWRF